MANFNKKTYGEGSTKGVDLVVSMYDNAGWEKETKDKQGNDVTRSGHYVQQTIHPDSPMAAGQVYLGLKSVKDDKGRINVSENLYPKQIEALKEAAGDNVSDLKDKDGNVVGKNYGVKANVMFSDTKDGKSRYAMLNSKTLAPSELSVAEVDGKTINDRVFESQAAAKAAKQAAEAAKGEQTAEVQAEAVEVEAPAADEPEFN